MLASLGKKAFLCSKIVFENTVFENTIIEKR